MSVWDGRKEILYGDGSKGKVSQTNPTPECGVNGTERYDGWSWVIYLFIVLIHYHEKVSVRIKQHSHHASSKKKLTYRNSLH